MNDERGTHDEPRKDEPAPQKQPSDYNDPVDEAADESFPASDPPSSTRSDGQREPSTTRDR